jgi:O-antigen ligase
MVCGGFSHSLTFGNYYGTAALFLAGLALAGRRQLSRQMRLFLISSSLLGMIATVLSYSRGPIAALAVGLVLLGLILGRRYLVYSLGTIAVAAVAILIIMPGLTARFSGKTTKDLGGVYEGGRVFIWKNSLRVIQENPIFGVGQGNFKAAYSSHLRADIPEKRKHAHAHNDLLNVAAISGIPGAVFFLGMWLAAIGYFWKGWRMRQKMGRDSSKSQRNRVGAGLVSAQDKELWRHKAATYASPHHVWDNLGPDGTLALAALVGSVVFFVTSLFEATFADEEVRQMLMFIWAAGLWLWYKGSNWEETITVKSA